MTGHGRPLVVVMGADESSPPPGIEAAAEVVELRYAPDQGAFTELASGADAVFAWQLDPTWLPSVWPAQRLRWIQSISAGVDVLLFPALVESDVEVTNARGVYDQPIAEWAIGAMLAFATGLHRSIVDQGRRAWTRGRSTERLEGARLTIVGAGEIGRATADRAIGLGMSVALVGRRPRPHETYGDVVGSDQLRRAVADADHVLAALPLTDDTRGLFDAAAFAAMPARARFYNVGRGPTVDEGALVDALRSGTIAGAALDVFDSEPLPADSPLWTMSNVIVSPHIAGDADGWDRRVVELFVSNARRFAAGQSLEQRVDKRAGYGPAAPPPDLGRGLPPGPSGETDPANEADP